MGFERTNSFQKQNSHTPQPTNRFESRPFAAPVQMKPQEQQTPEELANESFNQNKFEAFGLQLKEKSGTITPVEQEQLGLLQAKMNDFWQQRQERASRSGFNFSKVSVTSPGEEAAPQHQPMARLGTPGVPLGGQRSPLNSPQRSLVSPLQAKLTIGEPGDQYEQEADRVASQVVEQINAPASAQSTQGQSVQRQEEEPEEELQAKPEITALQRQEEPEEELQAKPEITALQRQEEPEEELQAKPEITALQRQEEPEEELQAKPSISNLQRSPLSSEVQREAMSEEDDLQAKSILQRREAIAVGEASTDLDTAINSARGGGQPLDAGLQRSMGQAMGADFSGVKVHTDAQSDQLNQSIQAKAFTTGQDVFFRQGAYEPGSRGGQELIAHELTHVVQQTGATLQRQVIQRLMTTDIWQQSTQSKIFNRGNNNPELIQIDNLLNIYHELTNANDPNVEQRLQVLTNIETTVYGWYNRRFDRNEPSQSKRLTAMYDLLDDIAQEHETLVAEIANNNMRLPIPNVNNNAVIPNSPEDAQLQQLWQSIVNETGNINFSTQDARRQEDYPDFKQKMLPIFARLLRTPTGRQLLTQISTTQPTGLSNEDQAAGRGNVTVRPVGQQEKIKGRIAAAGVKKYEAYRQGDARPNGGIGIGSYLTASAYDRETDVTRRGNAGIDTNTNPLLSPMFVILAHEMIHVLHNLRGQNRNQTSLDHWGNEEEKVTISGVDGNNNVVDPINEQAIRNEYGLNQPRYGHDE